MHRLKQREAQSAEGHINMEVTRRLKTSRQTKDSSAVTHGSRNKPSGTKCRQTSSNHVFTSQPVLQSARGPSFILHWCWMSNLDPRSGPLHQTTAGWRGHEGYKRWNGQTRFRLKRSDICSAGVLCCRRRNHFTFSSICHFSLGLWNSNLSWAISTRE